MSVRFFRNGNGFSPAHAVLVDGVAWLDAGALRLVRDTVERDGGLDPWIREAFLEVLAGGGVV
ncbi:MAG TPA: hypothetical protein VNO31_11235, partial [Umezawaea sp.]|nr:hypothetical protein [Umezawaea sp.]